MSEYAKRDCSELEPHYIKHVAAMTAEGLHAKSDIAAELAYRDQRIDELARRLQEAEQKIVAQEAKDNYVGKWLSAALDDPSVCEEMKTDIRLWMASDLSALAAHDNEMKAQALEDMAKFYDVANQAVARRLRAEAAEYRAKK